jgi:hypothetical protein
MKIDEAVIRLFLILRELPKVWVFGPLLDNLAIQRTTSVFVSPDKHDMN